MTKKKKTPTELEAALQRSRAATRAAKKEAQLYKDGLRDGIDLARRSGRRSD